MQIDRQSLRHNKAGWSCFLLYHVVLLLTIEPVLHDTGII